VAGTPGFGFGHGAVWGVHVACAGNAVHLVERVPEGYAVLGGGELLEPGELELAPGESYAAPTLHAACPTPAWTASPSGGTPTSGPGRRTRRRLGR